jgi:rod shape-determining protein MreC
VRKEKKNKWIIGVLIVVLLFFIFFEPAYGWKVRELFTSPNPTSINGQTLAAENQTLEAELATLQVVQSQLPSESPNEIRAMVYSRYPLNFKNELLVNAGSDQGVATGTAVLFQGIFIGQIEKVFSDSAIVQTIFDNNLTLPVRIGSSGYDGLLEGGPDPSIASIAKNAVIANGDIVYTAAPGIPYGLPIGEINTTSTSPDSLFQTASLNFTYDVNNIETVFIVQ